jgi:hypothetical protein
VLAALRGRGEERVPHSHDTHDNRERYSDTQNRLPEIRGTGLHARPGRRSASLDVYFMPVVRSIIHVAISFN